MIKFPSIEQFRHIVTNVKNRARFVGKDEHGYPVFDESKPLPTLEFRGTVKLHGTNASVVLKPDGTLQAQSRNRILAVGDDNQGFAAFVFQETPDTVWRTLFAKLAPNADKPVTIYGEWCGKGIAKKVAISELDQKVFVIFAARVGIEEATKWLDIEPFKADLCSHEHRIYNIFEFPSWRININFFNPQVAQLEMEKITLEVEKECPVGKALGISGTGEGVVWECIDANWQGSDFKFKVKGDEHKVTKDKVAKTLTSEEVEKLESVQEFIRLTVTENRCNQAIEYLKEMGKPITIRSLGDFIKWVFGDIVKEEYDTMEASGLTEKEVGKAVPTLAKEWYLKYIDSL